MKKKTELLFIILLAALAASSCRKEISEEEVLETRIFKFEENFQGGNFDFEVPPGSRIDSFRIDESRNEITFFANKEFSNRSFRNDEVNNIYSEINNFFGHNFGNYNFKIFTLGLPIEELVPNFYRDDGGKYDENRIAKSGTDKRIPVVQNLDKPYQITNGLKNKNIVVWNSHGWYYNNDLDRWMWQRPRLFQTVEDLIPTSFVLPYIIPMLENSGANVFVPRERDTQKHEVVIDNDQPGSFQNGIYAETDGWQTGAQKGFEIGNPPYPNNFNPFIQGTYSITNASDSASETIAWIPDIPEEGFYNVYISYYASEENIPDAKYSVHYSGGRTDFSVNQKIGGNTWIYLGNFKFEAGINSETGKVVLTNESAEPNKTVAADAVRFGGGMGIIEKGGRTGERPKFVEGARYYLQYAGMPDTLVYSLNENKSDYKDDYQSRGEYVNYLYGNPFGPNKDRKAQGLGIPVDLSLAFHTDAGESRSDTTIGTLVIYSVEDADSQSVFPDGVSRLASRDFADILQTEIVSDIRTKYDSVWRKRRLWEAQYSEAYRPNVPAALLELLSHQNFLDMQFMLDPRFRFDVSRSIYKAMLKFLSVQYGYNYVVHPLPVNNFQTSFNDEGNVELKWSPVEDPKEPTASPEHYVVYVRVNDQGFGNGIPVYDTTYVFENPALDSIYSFKVTAVNKGGESFPSEILAASKVEDNPDAVLIINAFDRISGPSIVDEGDFRGFLGFLENGVPDKYDLNYTGTQFNFNADSDWQTDDAPGHGASYGNMETSIVAGNTFDFPFVHGTAIKNAGHSFVSTSDESVMNGSVNLSSYKLIDIILGEERKTEWQKPFADSLLGIQFEAFPKSFRKEISKYLEQGGNLFISGAYLGSDLLTTSPDSSEINFAKEILKFSLSTDHAVKNGVFYSIDSSFFDTKNIFEFETELNDSIYAVESPDAIVPVNGAKSILRYAENRFSAATAYKNNYGVILFGFPFEAIKKEDSRNRIMNSILNYLLINKQESAGNH